MKIKHLLLAACLAIAAPVSSQAGVVENALKTVKTFLPDRFTEIQANLVRFQSQCKEGAKLQKLSQKKALAKSLLAQSRAQKKISLKLIKENFPRNSVKRIVGLELKEHVYLKSIQIRHALRKHQFEKAAALVGPYIF